MNIRTLIDQAIGLAHSAGEILPPLEAGAAIADQIVDVLDALKGVSPDAQATQDLEAAHAALLKRVTDRGHALSDRLRNG